MGVLESPGFFFSKRVGTLFLHGRYTVAKWYSAGLATAGHGFESNQWLLCTNTYSACHPSRVG